MVISFYFAGIMEASTILEQLMQENLPASAYQNKKDHLISKINDLLLNDFNKLILLLYRIDIDEKKLRALLQQNTGLDAAPLIAEMIFERIEEKKESKKKFRSADDISENDKW